jgi:hypothetical protein
MLRERLRRNVEFFSKEFGILNLSQVAGKPSISYITALGRIKF